MKIENTIKATETGAGDTSVSAAKSAPKASGTMISGEGVQLSAQLQALEKRLASGEAFNAARVEEIKQAISEGRFVVNPEKVADALLETVRDLIRGRQG
ncbi:MAG: flagellar biosynthesis anti-sigma factor FlgM [Nitrosospira sp.]|nr:flagellar biosynthesis anti-sigma factor FlgM [Nitrosospira sp.]